ncbi:MULTISPECIES: hypothetical protein [unclassified Rhodococcus (in: high G+C Gram-positive bacteria)]|uniref:hypothetical protein n=1 Tax=Rhodococcus sp. SJ-3 TaxID=3454628 RepID=UPI003F796E52
MRKSIFVLALAAGLTTVTIGTANAAPPESATGPSITGVAYQCIPTGSFIADLQCRLGTGSSLPGFL